MEDTPTTESDLDALNRFVVECNELPKLEALLGRFNLFEILKFEWGEIRHSNILAWILDPAASHGLADRFLSTWLMRVVHESHPQPFSPVEIDGWELQNVEVRREWRHIDLLLVLNMADRSQWVVCIENKVHSHQRSNQLKGYRVLVEKEFPDAKHRLFLFLTKWAEPPDDGTYLSASYDQVHRALTEAMANRTGGIGPEPRVLLDNYRRLLEEKFMNKSEIARIALAIYQKHRRAIDVIIDHRPENIRSIIRDKVLEMLQNQSGTLSIIVEPYSQKTLRFTPKQWDGKQNRALSGFAGTKRHILCEVGISAREAVFSVSSGKSPKPWIDELFLRAAQPPFQNCVSYPPDWKHLHHVTNAEIPLDDSSLTDPTETADAIFAWVKSILASTEMERVISIIAAELAKLPETCAV